MLKLSLRERIKFWLKNKIWLKESSPTQVAKYGLKIYSNINRCETQYWVLERKDNQNVLTQITKDTDRYTTLKQDEWLYLVGTEGVFAKHKEGVLTKIVDKECFQGAVIDYENAFIFAFSKKGKDFFGKLHENSLIDTVYCDELQYIGEEFIWKRERKDIWRVAYQEINVIAKDVNKIRFYHVESGNVYSYNELCFKSYGGVLSLFRGETIQMYVETKNLSALVTLVEGKIEVYGYYDNLVKVEEKYYFASIENEKCMSVLMTEENQLHFLESIPTGNYEVLGTIGEVRFYKMKNEQGVVLLAIHEKTVKYKQYEGAVDIKFSEPVLFDNGNVLEIKPVAVYEKVIEN